MANITNELAQIMQAVLGKDVRGSIHDAIQKINDVEEHQLDAGGLINAGDPATGYYDKSLYINTNTMELLRAFGGVWQNVGTIKGETGNGIDEITVGIPVGLVDEYIIKFTDETETKFYVTNGRGIDAIVKDTSGLTDTYTIHYNDDTEYEFSVDNAKSIESIEKTSTVDLQDTYTITFNTGETKDFIVTNGIDGNRWFRGVEVYGKQTNPTVFANSGITNARVNDCYLNPSEGAIYYCVLGGDAATALWVFDFNIAGGGSGVSTWGELLKKPFNYVDKKGGLEITGNTENDYTLRAKVDGSYIKLDENGALTINPDVLKGSYKFNPNDFRTDDDNKIVYLSKNITDKLSYIPYSFTQAEWNAISDKSVYEGKLIIIKDDYNASICQTIKECEDSTNPNDVAGANVIKEVSDKLSDIDKKITKPTSATKDQVLTFNGTDWVADDSQGGGSASDIDYDNATSKLTATDVQGAIDEVIEKNKWNYLAELSRGQSMNLPTNWSELHCVAYTTTLLWAYSFNMINHPNNILDRQYMSSFINGSDNGYACVTVSSTGQITFTNSGIKGTVDNSAKLKVFYR